MKKLEKELEKTLAGMERSIKLNDLQCANYWLVEHIKKVNELEPEMSFNYLEHCAVRYEQYRNLIETRMLEG